MGFLLGNISHMSRFNDRGVKHTLSDSARRDSWKRVPGFQQTSPHVPFPRVGSALDPFTVKSHSHGAFPVTQWQRTCLPRQETQVRSLIWEEPTRLRATKPMCHNYQACALKPRSCNYQAHMPLLLKLANPRAHAPQRAKPRQ